MKAKDYFKKINRLKTRIEFKLEKAKFYKEIAQGAASTVYSDMPRPPKGTVKSPMENALIKALDLELEAKQDTEELSKLTVEVMCYIDLIEDIRLQKVLILRYLKDMMWEDIGKEVHYCKNRVFHFHKSALKVLDDIIYKKRT